MVNYTKKAERAGRDHIAFIPAAVFRKRNSREAKSGIRPKQLDVEALIGPDEAALIGGLCSKEIETFDYSFDDVLAERGAAAPRQELAAAV